MLLSRLISLTAESSYPILGALGRPAQAWFLKQVTLADPAMASRLHDESGWRPYTVSTLLDENGRPLGAGMWLKPGQECWLRVTTFDESLSGLVEERVLKRLPGRMTLYKMDFRVNGVARRRAEHPWAGESSFSELAQDAGLKSVSGHARMEFASPTAFSRGGLELCLPLPGSVFRSLWSRWNAHCPESMQVQEAWPEFAEQCIFIRELTSINSTHWIFADGSRGGSTGFTGTAQFFLPKTKSLPEKWQPYTEGAAAVMVSLANFAFYAGVGHLTTVGMGQARFLPTPK